MKQDFQIVGLVVVKNEEFYIERVVRNIMHFCDRIILCDNGSEDRTARVLQELAAQESHIEFHSIRDMQESHELVAHYAGSPTWIFAVDGDELYDPEGLNHFRTQLKNGDFDHAFNLYGHCLHCEELDRDSQRATGYLTPEAKSCTKLYNFQVIHSWRGCRHERLHGGEVDFKEGWHYGLKYPYMETVAWDAAHLRCLHLCFLRRSSLDPEVKENYSRPNIVDIKQTAGDDLPSASAWKNEQYRRGEICTHDVSVFLGKEQDGN